MKTVNDLRSKLRNLQRDGPSRNATEAIMLRCRILLERHRWGTDFPTLQLMCHWVAHDSLRDSATIYEWLAKVTSAMRFAANTEETGRYAALIRTGATVLNLAGLREEVSALLDRAGLETFVADDESFWHEFCCGLLGVICERTIGLPDDDRPLSKPAKRYVEAFSANAPTQDYHVAAAKTADVFVEDGKFRVRIVTNLPMIWSFIVATYDPLVEFDAGDVPTSEWVTSLKARRMEGFKPIPGLPDVLVVDIQAGSDPRKTS